MVEPKDGVREDFTIGENFAAEKEMEISGPEQYDQPSDAFRKNSTMPFIIGGLVLVGLVVMLVIFLSRPANTVDPQQLQALESRLQELEKKLATVAVIDQAIERLGKQEQGLDQLTKKTDRLASGFTTQIDQIIKELGALHQKTSTLAAAARPKKQPEATEKAETKLRFHQVRAGDTLYNISRRYGLSIAQLQTYNNLAPNAAIYPGQKLKLDPHPER